MNSTSTALACGFLLVAAASASAQNLTRVSVDSSGVEGNDGSFSPALSADGRFVAFFSEASNLVPNDNNGAEDIFLRDRRTGVTVCASVDSTGVMGDGDSYSPAISGNGRFVAFYSDATNLVPGDTNLVSDVFVRDTWTGVTGRVSVDSAGVQGNNTSYYAAISANGRYVAFYSWANNLVAVDSNWATDVFVHDRWTRVTTLVSVDSAGVQGNDASEYPAISADGSRVVFQSRASNLVPNDANSNVDILVRDLALGTTVCASVDPNGVPGTLGCSYASISGDGKVVGFASGSSNLVPGDTNGVTDVFARNLVTGTTTRVSVSTAGVQSEFISQIHTPATISFDGRYIAFKSQGTTLVPGDTNGQQDIFVRDLRLLTTVRVSVDSLGNQANGRSSQPSISADGRFVGFYSDASNLVAGDTNGASDVFVRRMR